MFSFLCFSLSQRSILLHPHPSQLRDLSATHVETTRQHALPYCSVDLAHRLHSASQHDTSITHPLRRRPLHGSDFHLPVPSVRSNRRIGVYFRVLDQWRHCGLHHMATDNLWLPQRTCVEDQALHGATAMTDRLQSLTRALPYIGDAISPAAYGSLLTKNRWRMSHAANWASEYGIKFGSR